MAKRLTGTEKWRKGWFQGLTLKQKCLWIYLCDNCDLAGFWDENLRQATFEMGVKITIADIESLKDVKRDGKARWFITDFCQFQYGASPDNLDPENRVHKAIIRTFKKRGYEFDTLSDRLDRLSDLSDSAKDKDKKKDKDIVTDKDIPEVFQ